MDKPTYDGGPRPTHTTITIKELDRLREIEKLAGELVGALEENLEKSEHWTQRGFGAVIRIKSRALLTRARKTLRLEEPTDDV